LYLLLYRIFGYRKSVVMENLENAFPDKCPEEIEALCSDYYRYLCDLSLEILKTMSFSPEAVNSCFTYKDGALAPIEHFHDKNQSIILVLGHLGNWELTGAYFMQLGLHPLYVIYHPLANPQFDKLFYRMRTRSGIKLYEMKKTYKSMVRDKAKLTATAFIADQTPRPDNAHWMTFLNQDTAVFKGTESIAKMLDYPVIYISVIRQKRGLYALHTELLAEHPKEFAENELTELHTRRLERDIVAHPETWLWSHRRWKHKKPESDS
ncbi:MAG: lysophospholipid acyltransferase family protein, partial [Lysobacterales bacterium]